MNHELPTADVRTELLAVAAHVARACGRLIVEERPRNVGVAATKSSATDVVTVMDARSEQLARTLLLDRRPDDGLFGEEGLDRTGSSGITWVVDPIDGTVNYLYEIGAYAVSVAAVVGDPHVQGGFRPVAGAVYAPATDELFLASAGGGARLVRGEESRTLVADPARELAGSLVGTGFGYAPEDRAWQAAITARVVPAARDIRRHGSAALDLCAVAAGRLDAYYEFGTHAWDIAAGWLIAEEAGMTVRGPGAGAPNTVGSRPQPLVLAGRPEVLDALESLF